MQIIRALVFGGFVSGLSLSLSIAMKKAEANPKYPQPKYEVVTELDKRVEIRRYDHRILTQVEITGDDADRRAAKNMMRAAQAAGLKRIVYLGGLGEQSDDLSRHLRSRAEVSAILNSGRVPVTVFRAAMIVGSGSASFEILRYLVERLPFMITPRWVRTPSQPISVRNVLAYLIGCLEAKETIGQTFDIGGPDIITYQQLMDTYAEEAGLKKRLVVPVPFFTPRLSSYLIHLVTPVPAYIARPLAEGLRNPAVCKELSIRKYISQELLDCRTAIKLAISRLQHQQVESH